MTRTWDCAFYLRSRCISFDKIFIGLWVPSLQGYEYNIAICCHETLLFPDKQQEIDVPTLKVEDVVETSHKTKREKKASAPMSQIVGVRKLRHTNSFTGVVPKYGIDVPNEEELSKVRQLRKIRQFPKISELFLI